jgi:hypothetical protein
VGALSRGYFEEANRMGGLVAKMRLASLAQITSSEASTVEDTDDVLARLDDAMVRLRAEFPGRLSMPGDSAPVVPSPSKVATDETKALRRQLAAYVELMTQRSLFAGDVNATIRRIDEAASSTLDVERVSVWFLDGDRTKITCADLYERSSRQHSSGTVLFSTDYQPYFKALSSERTIAAHDAHKDPRTSCFSAFYLTPLSISSMLDVPIWDNGRMVGVVCHEHVGPARTWNGDEESFAYLMSSFVALALERKRR